MSAAKVIEYFVDRMGVPIEEVTRGLHVTPEYLRDDVNWIDNHDAYLLYRNAQHAVPGFSHRDWYKVGQASQVTGAPGYLKLILKALSVSSIYTRMPSMIRQISKVTELRIVDRSHGHIRLRYSITDSAVRTNYTIGAECWYHLGVLSAVPRLRRDKNPCAVTRHEFCSMSVSHILENCYDLEPSDYAYTSDGFVVRGMVVGKWIRLRTLDGTSDVFTGEYSIVPQDKANALRIAHSPPSIVGSRPFDEQSASCAPALVCRSATIALRDIQAGTDAAVARRGCGSCAFELSRACRRGAFPPDESGVGDCRTRRSRNDKQ